MMIQLVIFSWVAVIFVSAEMQLYPTDSDDLQSIVQSVKEDVDRHVKLMTKNFKYGNVAGTSDDESAVPPKSSAQNYAVVDDEISIDGPSEEIVEYLSDAAEAYYGSVKGRPSLDFPDYTDIPKTSFTCSGKTMHPPGFYADMDTGCQVFHVCWPDRRESFLCPMGTIFNQAISTCDYWYNSNCSLAYLFYETSSDISPDSSKAVNVPMTVPVHKTNSFKSNNPANDVIFFVSEFMPVKAKIVFYPKTEKQRPKIVVTASTGKTNKVSKSQKKSRSKHTRVPRSVDYASRYDDPLFKLKTNITFYRTWEFMNNAVEAIRNKESTAHLAPYAERIKEFFKSWILMDEIPMMVHVEPGSELEEYDKFWQGAAKNMTLIFRKFVELGSWFMHYDPEDSEETQERNWKALQEDDELLAFMDEPLTNLNPRFLMKPPTEMKFKERNGKSRFDKSRIKRDTATLKQLKLALDDENIYPETKEALLKSYVKLYKAKHA